MAQKILTECRESQWGSVECVPFKEKEERANNKTKIQNRFPQLPGKAFSETVGWVLHIRFGG